VSATRRSAHASHLWPLAGWRVFFAERAASVTALGQGNLTRCLRRCVNLSLHPRATDTACWQVIPETRACFNLLEDGIAKWFLFSQSWRTFSSPSVLAASV
jgi:hypothetical protein